MRTANHIRFVYGVLMDLRFVLFQNFFPVFFFLNFIFAVSKLYMIKRSFGHKFPIFPVFFDQKNYTSKKFL
jgi:hypothetical protein